MPKAFEDCIANGGRVRTITPKAGKYLHICYLNGKSYSGEVKTAKKGKIMAEYKKRLKKT